MHSDLFSAVGTTIGESLNTAFGMAYTFIDKFEFDTFGTKVAELLNNAFDRIDFDLIANTITGSINGVFEAILNFATEFKWGENSQKIADGIKTLFDGIKKTNDKTKANIELNNINFFFIFSTSFH